MTENEVEFGVAVNDPATLFVWWEVSEAKREAAEDSSDGLIQWCLNVKDVDTSNQKTVEVDMNAGNHYVDVNPGHTYQVELGWSTDSEFHGLDESESVKMPSGEPSSESQVEWVDVSTGKPVTPENESAVDEQEGDEPSAGLEWDEDLMGAGASEGMASSDVLQSEQNMDEEESALDSK